MIKIEIKDSVKIIENRNKIHYFVIKKCNYSITIIFSVFYIT